VTIQPMAWRLRGWRWSLVLGGIKIRFSMGIWPTLTGAGHPGFKAVGEHGCARVVWFEALVLFIIYRRVAALVVSAVGKGFLGTLLAEATLVSLVG
jgi:hypothetical protein